MGIVEKTKDFVKKKKNDLMKHFLFSNIVLTITNAVRETAPDKDFGKTISVSFLVYPDKTILRIKLERYSGDSTLIDSEEKQLLSTLGINKEKEMQGNKSVFAILNVEKNVIFISYNSIDGKNDKTINI